MLGLKLILAILVVASGVLVVGDSLDILSSMSSQSGIISSALIELK